jgi:hypothetical protein
VQWEGFVPKASKLVGRAVGASARKHPLRYAVAAIYSLFIVFSGVGDGARCEEPKTTGLSQTVTSKIATPPEIAQLADAMHRSSNGATGWVASPSAIHVVLTGDETRFVKNMWMRCLTQPSYANLPHATYTLGNETSDYALGQIIVDVADATSSGEPKPFPPSFDKFVETISKHGGEWR